MMRKSSPWYISRQWASQPGRAADGEEHGEHVVGDAGRAEDEPGVEIHVGVEVAGEEVVVLERDLLQAQGDVEAGGRSSPACSAACGRPP